MIVRKKFCRFGKEKILDDMNSRQLFEYAKSLIGTDKGIDRKPATYSLRNDSRLLLKTLSKRLNVPMNSLLDALVASFAYDCGRILRDELPPEESFVAIEDIATILNRIEKLDYANGITSPNEAN